ncbi:MAG: IclR family transcriptional regulator [Actinomycetota bacterium]
MAGVQSIERAFAILRALALQPAGITELAARTALPKSTVARLLGALEAEGAVTQVEAGGEYRLGPGIEDIAAGSQPGRNLVAIARPFLIDLTERTGEASGLDTLDEGWVYFLDQVASETDVQVRDWTGEYGQAHTVPAGVVMLAHSPDGEVDAYIDQGLDLLTPNTVTDGEELRERLQQVRSAGYAWGFEEFAEGINSVAAPVFGPAGVEAAIHVHGPAYRFPDPDRTHDLGLLVAEAAELLSAQLQG